MTTAYKALSSPKACWRRNSSWEAACSSFGDIHLVQHRELKSTARTFSFNGIGYRLHACGYALVPGQALCIYTISNPSRCTSPCGHRAAVTSQQRSTDFSAAALSIGLNASLRGCAVAALPSHVCGNATSTGFHEARVLTMPSRCNCATPTFPALCFC